MAQILIQSIGRAAEVLEFVAFAGGSSKLQEIADGTGLGKTTAHNIVKTLQQLGYLHRRVGDTRYYLGEQILNLARILGDDAGLRAWLRPTMENIARRTGEAVYLAVPSGDEIYYLDFVQSSFDERRADPTGQRECMAGSAIGLVFLASMPRVEGRLVYTRGNDDDNSLQRELESVRSLGYALDIGNHSPAQNCVAIPWRRNGEVKASIAIGGPSSRLTRNRLVEFAWVMLKETENAY